MGKFAFWWRDEPLENDDRNDVGRDAPGSASMASSPVSDTGAGAPHEALTGADAQ